MRCLLPLRILTRDRIHNLHKAMLGCGIGCDDPLQLSEEWQAGCFLPFEHYDDDREVRSPHSFVERFVIFKNLPGTEAFLSNQQNEGGSLRDFFGKRGLPISTGAQALWCEENMGS